MATSGMIVTGVRELDRMLRELEPKLQKKLARKAVRKETKEIVLAQALRDVPRRTGKLASTLTVRALKRGRGRVGSVVITKEGQYSNADGDQFPGAFLEFGTKQRKTKSGRSTGQIPKREFGYLRSALYDNQERVHELFVGDVRELLREAGFGK